MSLENPVERSLDRTLTFLDSKTRLSSHAEGHGTFTRSADDCKPSASAAFQRNSTRGSGGYPSPIYAAAQHLQPPLGHAGGKCQDCRFSMRMREFLANSPVNESVSGTLRLQARPSTLVLSSVKRCVLSMPGLGLPLWEFT